MRTDHNLRHRRLRRRRRRRSLHLRDTARKVLHDFAALFLQKTAQLGNRRLQGFNLLTDSLRVVAALQGADALLQVVQVVLQHIHLSGHTLHLGIGLLPQEILLCLSERRRRARDKTHNHTRIFDLHSQPLFRKREKRTTAPPGPQTRP